MNDREVFFKMSIKICADDRVSYYSDECFVVNILRVWGRYLCCCHSKRVKVH